MTNVRHPNSDFSDRAPRVETFGQTRDGDEVLRLTISAGNLTVLILTLGAIVHSVRLRGAPGNLVLSSPDVSAYQNRMQSFGSVIGPLANRLSKAECVIDGQTHNFEKNQANKHMLHSGGCGTHLKLWRLTGHSDTEVSLQLNLPHGEGGFPGNRVVRVTYCVAQPSILTQTITVDTTASTLVNFTGHSYWNLGDTGSIKGHRLQVFAESHLPTTPDKIPTGEIAPVQGTPYDYRNARLLEPGNPALDHNFCLSLDRNRMKAAARLTGECASLRLETTEPGLQVYDARGTDACGFAAYAGMALEAQGWPDAPNHPHFPSVILPAGKTYVQSTKATLSLV